MAPSSKFQWAIQKINGPYHKPNGPFFTCIFRFWKLCNQLSLYFSCQLSYTLYKTFYFHLSKARAKVFRNLSIFTVFGPFTFGFSSFIVRFWHLTFILSFTFRVNARVNVIAMIGTFVNGSICINWIVIIIYY
jgi:hypothetical protein